MKKRVLSLFMALMLCFSLLPTAMLAEEPAAAEAQTEQPVLEEPKQEEPVQSKEPAQAEKPDAQEGGLQERETPSVPEKKGDESDAAVRSAQELIDALPHEATAENAEEIEAQLAVLEEMLAKLTEEQTAMLDTTRYEALCKSLADLTVAQTNGHADHPLCGDADCQKHGEALTGWIGVSDLSEIKDAGNYYLLNDVTGSGWSPADNVVLCLNGYSISSNQDYTNATAGIIRIDTGRTFTLTDCNGSGENHGVITHTDDAIGRGVYVSGKATFNMYGGRIIGNTTQDTSSDQQSGGGVRVGVNSEDGIPNVYHSGTFNMYGGEIIGNTAYNGGGVFLDAYDGGQKGVFHLYNGTISDNVARANGGGVYANAYTEFTMENGTISGNRAGSNGGGVYVLDEFTMSDGDIIGNTTKYNGGGVLVSNSDNTTGKFTMTGGSVTGNNVERASGYGGGVIVNTDAVMKVSGDVRIQNNWKGGTPNETSGLYEQGSGTASNLFLSGSNDQTNPSGETPVILTGEILGTIGISKSDSRLPTEEKPVRIAVSEGHTLRESDAAHFIPDAGEKYQIEYQSDDKALYMVKLHQHSWKYTANGATITATCEDTACKESSGGSVTVKAPAESTLTYNGSEKPAALEGGFTTGVTMPEITYVLTGDTPLRLEAGAAPKNAGTYTAGIEVEGAAAEVTYQIKKAVPTAEDFTFAPPADQTYDGNAKYAVISPKSGIIGMGSVIVKHYNSDGTSAVTPKNVGTYTVRLAVGEGTNYTAADDDLTDSAWTFAILPNVYEPTVILSGDMTYTGEPIRPQVTVKVGTATLVEGTDYTVTYGENRNAGANAGTVTVTAKDNYAFADVVKSFAIAQKKVTVSGITAANKTYNGSASAVLDYSHAVIEGKLEKDNLTVDTAAGVFDSADAGNGKTVTISGLTLGGAAKGNYTLAADGQQTETAADIAQAVITVTPGSGQSKTYGAAEPALDYAAAGAVNGEIPAFTGALTRASGEDVGSYVIGRGTLALEDNGNFKAGNYKLKFSDAVVSFTISKADYGTQYASGSAMYGNSGTADLSRWIAKGGKASLGSVTDVDGVLDGMPTVSGTALHFAFKDEAANKDKTASVSINVTDAVNYEHYVIIVTLTVKNKFVPSLAGELLLSPDEITYGQPLSEITITGTMQLGSEAVEGTFAWQKPDEKLTAGTHRDVAWKFTPDNAKIYAVVTGTATVTVNKAVTTGEPNYTKIISGGKTLEEANLTLTGSTLNPLEGTLEWIDDEGNVLPGNTKVEANKTYQWRFTPADENYTVLTGEIELYHKSGRDDALIYCTIKVIAGENGRVSPSGSLTVREGRDQTFTFIPDEGYGVAKVLVDGKSVSAATSYTFKNITKDHTLEVVFLKTNGNPQTGVPADFLEND